jgi:TonB family protein
MPTVGAPEKTQLMEVTVKADRKALAGTPPPEVTVRAPRTATPPPVPAPPLPKPAPPPPQTVAAPVPPIPEEGPAPEEGPKPSGVPAGLILGGAALVFLLVAVVAAIALWRHFRTGPSPAPTPIAAATPVAGPTPVPTESPAPATTGTLRVETQPAGATVTVNGEARGVTPVDIADLPLGTYEVKLELKGFETRTQTVELSVDSATGLVILPLAKQSPSLVQGTVDVLSTPFGAAVSVDGTRVGVTPLQELKLKAGTRRIEVVKEGYEPFTQTLKVEAGKRASIDAQLKALPKPTPIPTPNPDAVDTSKVYLNLASEVDTLAKKVSGKSISYPENAPRLKSGDSVSVTVSFVVSESGDVGDLKIVESGGKVLDEAVMAAVRTWKYTPAVKKGTKVKAGITFKQTFRAG